MRSVRHVATGGIPLLFGVAAAWASLQLPVGSLTKPGPGMWPLVVSVVLIAGSLLVLVGAETEQEPFSRQSLSIVAALVLLALFTTLFSLVGFVLPATLMLAVWLRFISKESWKVTLATTIPVVALLYVLFSFLLGVPFPFDIITGR